jgi:hypothetical protein
MRKESWGRWGGGEERRPKGVSQPAHFVYFSLGVVGSCSLLQLSAPTRAKLFFLQHRFGVKKTKALLKVAYLKCFFLWNLPVEKFGWAVVGQVKIF